MRCAVIVNGIVENVILVEALDDFPLEPGQALIETEAGGIGWSWSGSDGFAPPAQEEPVLTKPELVAYAADRRWQREQAGTTWNGWSIHTDDRSQGKYLSELQAISLGVRVDNDPWKFADGEFRPVSNADFPQLAIAAREHVRTVFGIEAGVLAEIEAGTITTRPEIDAAFA